MFYVKLSDGWKKKEKKRQPLRQELHLHDRRSAKTSSYTEEEIKPPGHGRYCVATRPLLRQCLGSYPLSSDRNHRGSTCD